MPPEHDANYTPAQVLVLERLTRIETMLTVFTDQQRRIDEDLRAARATADDALDKANNTEKAVAEIKDNNRWAFRMTVGLVFGFVVNFVINMIQSL